MIEDALFIGILILLSLGELIKLLKSLFDEEASAHPKAKYSIILIAALGISHSLGPLIEPAIYKINQALIDYPFNPMVLSFVVSFAILSIIGSRYFSFTHKNVSADSFISDFEKLLTDNNVSYTKAHKNTEKPSYVYNLEQGKISIKLRERFIGDNSDAHIKLYGVYDDVEEMVLDMTKTNTKAQSNLFRVASIISLMLLLTLLTSLMIFNSEIGSLEPTNLPEYRYSVFYQGTFYHASDIDLTNLIKDINKSTVTLTSRTRYNMNKSIQDPISVFLETRSIHLFIGSNRSFLVYNSVISNEMNRYIPTVHKILLNRREYIYEIDLDPSVYRSLVLRITSLGYNHRQFPQIAIQ